MSAVMSEDDRFRAELDTLSEEEVRARLVLDVYGARKRPLVVDWLAQQAESRQADEQERQELREDEALVLARRADKRAATLKDPLILHDSKGFGDYTRLL
jgi:hypothetical protein